MSSDPHATSDRAAECPGWGIDGHICEVCDPETMEKMDRHTHERVRVDFWGESRIGYVVTSYGIKTGRVLGVVFRDADIPEGLRYPRVNWYRDDEVERV